MSNRDDRAFDAAAIDDLFEEIPVDRRLPPAADAGDPPPVPPDASLPETDPGLVGAASAILAHGEPPRSAASTGPEPPATDPDPLSAKPEPSATGPEPQTPATVEPPLSPAAGAPRTPATVAEARSTIEQLDALTRQLRALADQGKPNRRLEERALEDARQCLRHASETLDRSPANDPTFEILRDELLDGYFALDRLVQTSRPSAAPSPHSPRPRQKTGRPDKRPAPKKPAPRKRPTTTVAAQMSADQRRAQRRRLIALYVLLVLLAGGRGGYYVMFEAARPEVEPRIAQLDHDGHGVATRVEHAGKLARNVARGVPIVTFVRLSRDSSGALRATAAAVDIDSSTLTLTFKWFKDDKLVKLENQGLLAAEEVEGFASYRVEVTATDGKLTSAPLASAPLAIKGAVAPDLPNPAPAGETRGQAAEQPVPSSKEAR